MKNSTGLRKILTPALVAVAAILLFAGAANADNITFNTYPSDSVYQGVTIKGTGLSVTDPVPASLGWSWNYTGNPADTRYGPLYVLSSSNFSFTIGADGLGGTNTTSGNGLTSYPGYEYMYFQFSLPANATNVAVHFSLMGADDRQVLSVNNNLIGGYQYIGSLCLGPGPAPMLGWGGTITNVDFTHTTNIDLTDQALFTIGGVNYLRFWINNTFSQYTNATARPHDGLGDPSTLVTAGYISYDTSAVPIPPSVLLLGSGLLGLGAWRRFGG